MENPIIVITWNNFVVGLMGGGFWVNQVFRAAEWLLSLWNIFTCMYSTFITRCHCCWRLKTSFAQEFLLSYHANLQWTRWHSAENTCSALLEGLTAHKKRKNEETAHYWKYCCFSLVLCQTYIGCSAQGYKGKATEAVIKPSVSDSHTKLVTQSS